MTVIDERQTAGITEPGRYELTEAEYHADPVAGGSLSSTGARTLVTRTPAHFAWQREHGRPDTTFFDVGRVAHEQLLGVGSPLVEVHADDWRTKAAKQAAEDARADGATPLLSKDIQRVESMVAAVRAHPIAGPLFAREGRAEQSFIARDPESEVMCRIRLDWMPEVEPGARLIGVDLKTSADADPRGPFPASMARYGYHQQDPFYCDPLTWLELADPELEPLFVFVVVEKEPPHPVAVGRPTARAREWGRVLNRKARDLYRECTEAGHWPGYEERVHEFDLPGWQVAAYERDQDAGRFDTTADLEEFSDEH